MTYLSLELDGHRSFAAVTREDPQPGPGLVVVDVKAANLCPTDVKKWDDEALASKLNGRPLTLGHEFAGVVSAIGADVTGVEIGQRVAVDPVIRCGVCDECVAGRPQFCANLLGIGAAAGDAVACAELVETTGIGGGFAQKVVVPATNLLPLPDDLSFEAGALVEPLADVMASIEAAALVEGDVTAVMGLGPMGLLHVEALLAEGFEVIGVDLREDRRAVVEALGARAVHPDDLPPVNAVFITAGGGGHVPATQKALETMRSGGRSVLFSSAPKGVTLEIDSNRLHYRRQSLVGVVGFDRHHALDAIRVLRTGRISVDMIRQPHVALADLNKAFENVLEPGVLKTAIDI